MKKPLHLLAGLGALLLSALPAAAQDKLPVVASFSIMGDLVKQIGGDRVDVTTIVGPNADAHGYQPKPADAKAVAQAKLLFVNGLGFDAWMQRLAKSSGSKGAIIVASAGVKPLKEQADGHGHGEFLTPPALGLGDGLKPQAKTVANAHGQGHDGGAASQHLE